MVATGKRTGWLVKNILETSISKGVCSVFCSFCQSIQADAYRCGQVHRSRQVQPGTTGYNQIQPGLTRCNQMQAVANRCRQVQAYTGRSMQVQAGDV